MKDLKKPTGEQCESNELVFEDDGKNGYACWYPQMGGYVGTAVALFDKSWKDDSAGSEGGCVDVAVWHDGEFPFDDGCDPVMLHHCDPQQFIDFGEWMLSINNANNKNSECGIKEGGE